MAPTKKTTTSLPGLMGSVSKKAPTGGTTTKKTTTNNNAAVKKAAADLEKTQNQLNTLLGQLGSSIGSGGVTAGGRTDASYMAEGRSGTSNTGKNYINGKLATPQEWAEFISPGGSNNAGATTAAADAAAEKAAERQSAYDLLYSQFNQYGLGQLVEGIKGLITQDVSPAEFTIRLRETDAYKKRFSANAARVQKGLAAINEAEYIGLEDQYQNIMRQYGMPESYYTKGEMGVQEGFTKFIANDISASELEDRIMTAQDRVLKANPEVSRALKEFYPDITNGDILAYSLDPANAIKNIQRKVTAAELGGAALQAGLQTGVSRAEELAAAGVTKGMAQQQYGTIAELAGRGGQLAAIYGQTPYGQNEAEAELFNIQGQTEAAKQRKKLTSLETAAFSASSGAAQGALSRDRAISGGAYRQSGAGSI